MANGYIRFFGDENSAINPQVAIFNETQPFNTDGGTFTAGSWITRIINTSVVPQSWASLSSNQVTLTQGTYLIEATCPAYNVDRAKAKLFNVSNSSDEIIGVSTFSGHSATNVEAQINCVVLGTLVVASGSKTFELQQQCQTTMSVYGFGIGSGISGTAEVYSILKITKLA